MLKVRPNEEEVFKKYEDVLEYIYSKQTRGEFTWRGVLSAFLRELELQKSNHATYRGA